MKKIIRILLLTAIAAVALCVAALAADPTTGGAYNVQVAAGQRSDHYLMESASGAVTASTVTIKNAQVTDFYAGAVKFTIQFSGLTANSQYLFLALDGTGVPTSNNIAYIDQGAAPNTATITFTAYPNSFADGNYRLYLVGAGKEFDVSKPLVTFSYYQPYTLGDVNADGSIDTSDALLVLQHAAEKITLKDNRLLAADVAAEQGTIDTSDALKILMYAAEKIDSFN
jgi:hypothetical protein